MEGGLSFMRALKTHPEGFFRSLGHLVESGEGIWQPWPNSPGQASL